MHELTLAAEILATSLQEIEPNEVRRLARVHVVVGAGSHVDHGILSDAFAMAAAGSGAPDAILKVETLSSLCPACDAGWDVPRGGLAVTLIEVSD